MIVDKIDKYIKSKDRSDFKPKLSEEQKKELFETTAGMFAHSLRRQLLPSDRAPREQGKLYPSEATKCARQLLYKFMQVPGEPLNGGAIMKFLMGDLIESSFLLAAGLTGRAIENNNLKMKIMIGGKERSGAIDGTTKRIGRAPRRLVEIKSMSAWSFKDFSENGLTDDFGYLGQLMTYMRQAVKDKLIDKPEAVYLAMNKDSQDIDERLIPYMPEYAEAADRNFELVERYAAKRKVMQRPVKYSTRADKKGNHKILTGLTNTKGELPLGCSYCPLKYTCWVGPIQIVRFDDAGEPLYEKKPTQHVQRSFRKNWKGGMKPVFHVVDSDPKQHELNHITEAGEITKW